MEVARLFAVTEQQVSMKLLERTALKFPLHHVHYLYAGRNLISSDSAHLDKRDAAQLFKEAFVADLVGFVALTCRGLDEKGEVEVACVSQVGIPAILVILFHLLQGTRVEVDRELLLGDR